MIPSLRTAGSKQVVLEIIEFLRKVNLIAVRPGQALIFLPEGFFFMLGIGGDCGQRRGLIDEFAAYKDRYEELARFILTQSHSLPGIFRIKELKRLTGGEVFAFQRNQVGQCLAGTLVVKTIELLYAGIGHLNRVFGDPSFNLKAPR